MSNVVGTRGNAPQTGSADADASASAGTGASTSAATPAVDAQRFWQPGQAITDAYLMRPDEPATAGNVRKLWDASAGPQQNDLTQGTTGDCWLVASLQAMAARDPDMIKRAIVPEADGSTFDVTLHRLDGTAETERVDMSSFMAGHNPLDPNGEAQLSFEHNANFWGQIAERAVQQFGLRHRDAADPDNWHAEQNADKADPLNGGWPQRALKLFGGEGTYHDITDRAQGEALLQQAQQAGGPVLAAIDGAPPANGLWAGHSYVVNEITDTTVTVHNPVGSRAGRVAGAIAQDANGNATLSRDDFLRYFNNMVIGSKAPAAR